MGDVPFLPMFPERPDVEMRRAGIAQDLLKGAVGTVAYADQRTEDVERHQFWPQTRGMRFIVHRMPIDGPIGVLLSSPDRSRMAFDDAGTMLAARSRPQDFCMTIPFKTIRSRAEKRKGGPKALNRLLPPKPDPKALAKLGDDRVLAE